MKNRTNCSKEKLPLHHCCSVDNYGYCRTIGNESGRFDCVQSIGDQFGGIDNRWHYCIEENLFERSPRWDHIPRCVGRSQSPQRLLRSTIGATLIVIIGRQPNRSIPLLLRLSNADHPVRMSGIKRKLVKYASKTRICHEMRNEPNAHIHINGKTSNS